MSNKILHITNNDHDGAGLAVTRLHKSMLKKGIKSFVLVATKKNENLGIHQLGYSVPKKQFFIELLTFKIPLNIKQLKDILFFIKSKFIDKFNLYIYRPKSLFNFNYGFSRFKQITKYIEDFDTVVLYSIQGMLVPSDIVKIHKKYNKKIIFRPLDMEPLTGGCHFNYDCEGWMDGCKNCPQIGIKFFADVSSKILNNKQKLYSEIPIHWIASNSYVLNKIKSSVLTSSEHKFSTIFYGVDKSRYKSVSSIEARNFFNLPLNKKIILFGCSDFSDKRKGAILLKKALNNEITNKNDLCLVTFGNKNGFSFDCDNIEWIHLGMLSSDYQLNAVYRAADLFVSPSLDDLGPVIMIEAFVNDLPIVSFDIGVANDLIINNLNGNLVKRFEIQSLTNSISSNVFSSKKDFQKNPVILQLKNQCMIETEASLFLEHIL